MSSERTRLHAIQRGDIPSLSMRAAPALGCRGRSDVPPAVCSLHPPAVDFLCAKVPPCGKLHPLPLSSPRQAKSKVLVLPRSRGVCVCERKREREGRGGSDCICAILMIVAILLLLLLMMMKLMKTKLIFKLQPNFRDTLTSMCPNAGWHVWVSPPSKMSHCP